jgi:hypothetical protein
MEAELKEFTNGNGSVVMAVIWVSADHTNIAVMNDARVRLNNFISNYVGRREHNLYMHTERDTVSATIMSDLNSYQGQTIQI